MIERVSGQTYEGFLRDNIFAPLKMLNTGYDDGKAIIPHRALGYSRDGIRIIRAPYLHMPIGKSAGGLYSTVDDLSLWDAQIMFTFMKDEKGQLTHLTYNRTQRAPKIR